MSDDELLNVIASVCDFDRVGVEKWRAEALLIGRAVERASRATPATNPDAVSTEYLNGWTAGYEQALKEQERNRE